jgi:hypothetical protein
MVSRLFRGKLNPFCSVGPRITSSIGGANAVQYEEKANVTQRKFN